MSISKKLIIISIVVVVIISLIVFFPYIKAEYLTFRYGDEFSGLEQQTNMLEKAKFYKIISYSKDKATVFYVSDTGDLITFKKENNEWEMNEWKTIWSTSGSADGFYWPYYR